MAKRSFRHALVVGASSGMGEALARRLAASGARVALVARREEELQRIVGEINDLCGDERAIYRVHDVADVDEVAALFEELPRQLGGLDLVVYAAGLMVPVAFDEYASERRKH